MVGRAIDIVPLGSVWEFIHGARDYGPTWPSIPAVTQYLFQTSELPVTGRRPNKPKRKPIRYPADYEIEWLGGKSLRSDIYAEAYARRRIDFCGPWLAIYDKDVFEDLAVRRSDWEKLLEHLASLGLVARATPSAEDVPFNALPQIPKRLISDYFAKAKQEPCIPTQAAAVEEIQSLYKGRYTVTRKPVIDEHRLAFPGFRRGKR